MTAPKGTGCVMVSRMANSVEDGVRLVAEAMTEPWFQDRSDPENYRPLRQIAQHLLDNPDLIPPSPWKPHLIAILQQFVADNPRRKLDGIVITDLVNYLLLDRKVPGQTPMKPPEARRIVARALGRNVGAVKQSHLRAYKLKKPKMPQASKMRGRKRKA